MRCLVPCIAILAQVLASASLSQQCTWEIVNAGTPNPARSAFSAYDPTVGRVIRFGGATDETYTWEWNQTRWERTPWTPLLGDNPGRETAAFDTRRNRSVVIGPSSMWFRVGHQWTRTTIPIPPVTGPLAYDHRRDRVVLFAGASETWEFDGGGWQRVSTTGPSARYEHAMVYDAHRERVVLFGGAPLTAGSGFFLGDTWEWDGSTWTQVATSGPRARRRHSMWYDPARQCVSMFGGNAASPGSYNADDVWDWDGSGWSQRIIAPGPRPRALASVTHDPVSNCAILFGGYCHSGLPPENQDTWELHPTGWVQRGPIDPPGRARHAMAYDSIRNRTVLYGGELRGDVPGESGTWEWDGSNWLLVPTFEGPGERSECAMAFDPARGRTVLFGGKRPYSGPLLGDTWEWDGTGWTLMSITGPAPRSNHAMCYDHVRGRVLMYGTCPTAPETEFWEWDGAVWSPITDRAPGPRMRHAMAADPARGKVLLFGSDDPINPTTDTWEWDGTAWRLASPVLGWNHVAHASMAFDTIRNSILMFHSNGDQFTLYEWGGHGWSTQRLTYDIDRVRDDAPMVFDSLRGRLVIFGGLRSSVTTSSPLSTTLELQTATLPTVTAHPASATANPGSSLSFTVAATAPGPLTYQWYRSDRGLLLNGPGDEGTISGADTPILTITGVRRIGGPTPPAYACRVSTPCGYTTSFPATLTVPACGSADFNNDSDHGTDDDIAAFFACLARNCCPTCGVADFNGDGDTGTDQDIEAFFRVLAGGTC